MKAGSSHLKRWLIDLKIGMGLTVIAFCLITALTQQRASLILVLMAIVTMAIMVASHMGAHRTDQDAKKLPPPYRLFMVTDLGVVASALFLLWRAPDPALQASGLCIALLWGLLVLSSMNKYRNRPKP